MVWNDEDSELAEFIFAYVHAHGTSNESAIRTALQDKHSQITDENFKCVWERLQEWPHSCELSAATLDMPSPKKIDSPNLQPPPKLPLAKISAQRYYVYIDEWRAFMEHGTLTLSAFEFLAKIFRRHLPSNILLYAPGILSTAKPTLTKSQILQLPRFHTEMPQTRVYLYLSKSKHWALFFVRFYLRCEIQRH